MHRRIPPKKRRAGFTVTEMIAAMFLFGVALIAVVQLTIFAHRCQHELWRQQLTRETLANIAEEINLVPWAELSEDRLSQLTIDLVEQDQLPGSTVTVNVSEVNEGILAKRITLELSSGEHRPREQLTVWRFQMEQGT